jgi:hypothetical protein
MNHVIVTSMSTGALDEPAAAATAAEMSMTLVGVDALTTTSTSIGGWSATTTWTCAVVSSTGNSCQNTVR